ncbi:MAG: hypothetical protein IIA41_10855 [SAR324 cluster bacterium]|nr:hypothetical protein [SAR324 cluster bacterium]
MNLRGLFHLVGDGKGKIHCLACPFPCVRRRHELGQSGDTELMVMGLIRLNLFPVQPHQGGMAVMLQVTDKHFISLNCDCLPRELASGQPLDCRLQPLQGFEQRRIPCRHGIEILQGHPHIHQVLGDEPIVASLVPYLPSKSELDIQLRSGGHPICGDLAGLDLVLERDLEQRREIVFFLDFLFDRVRLQLAKPRI